LAVGDKILFIATEVLPNASTDPQYRGPPQVWTTYQGQAGTASDYKVLKSDNGFRQSADEVRTITEISGEALTWDAPLAHAHKVYGGTLPHGQVVTLNPPVCNLTRSIVFRSAEASEGGDLADLQQRAQVMLCHEDDVQVRYVEFRDTGRSSTDPSLVRADGKLAYATDPAATPPPAPITNPLNVPGFSPSTCTARGRSSAVSRCRCRAARCGHLTSRSPAGPSSTTTAAPPSRSASSTTPAAPASSPSSARDRPVDQQHGRLVPGRRL
jgi:hypothetical protein